MLRCQVYGLRGVPWWLCVYFIWLDMTTPPWCREKVMVYYNYYVINAKLSKISLVTLHAFNDKLNLCDPMWLVAFWCFPDFKYNKYLLSRVLKMLIFFVLFCLILNVFFYKCTLMFRRCVNIIPMFAYFSCFWEGNISFGVYDLAYSKCQHFCHTSKLEIFTIATHLMAIHVYLSLMLKLTMATIGCKPFSSRSSQWLLLAVNRSVHEAHNGYYWL